MQLVCRMVTPLVGHEFDEDTGAFEPVWGDPALTVVATAPDGQAIDASPYDGEDGSKAVVIPYAGPAETEDLLGRAVPDGAVSLRDYAAARRYALEVSGVTVTVGGDKTVPMSTRREDREGARDTLIAILAGMRQDGAAYKFADGVSRPATNAEMQAAIGAAFAHVQAAYDREADVVAKTGGKKPSITDYAGVDAAFA